MSDTGKAAIAYVKTMYCEIERLRALNSELIKALGDATAHLAGAASAYREYARSDAVFRTRANDFDKAVERARAAYAKAKGADKP